MRKIMFSDKFGLTDAVIAGTKTMTRRLLNPQPHWWRVGGIPHSSEMQPILPAYEVGEIVAVAQAYKDILSPDFWSNDAGFKNKMFVKANLMPHQIRITGIDTQLLHDISDEECLREGIMREWIEAGSLYHYYLPGVPVKSKHDIYSTPVDAFAALIDKISGKGTWYKNPWVFVYEFELVK